MDVIGRMPRHEFVPSSSAVRYLNRPLPIGFDKTVSQPYIVALMTDMLDVQPNDVVLEIGSGAGYQAAILAELVKRVYTVDIIEELATAAGKRLKRLGYGNIDVRVANGYYGWAEHAPYDKIIVTAACDLIPPPLLGQLKPGGRMVIPTGIREKQVLTLVQKSLDGRSSRGPLPCGSRSSRNLARWRARRDHVSSRRAAVLSRCNTATFQRMGRERALSRTVRRREQELALYQARRHRGT